MDQTSIREYHEKVKAAAGGEWFDFEGIVRDIYSCTVKAGDFALDVGVNEGVHSLHLCDLVGESGLIVGVEAIPELATKFEHRLEREGVPRSKYRLHNVAVSNYQGSATFSWVKGATGLSSLAKREVARAYQPEDIIIPVTTIDALIRGINRPLTFAKLDIEGAEFHAMQKGLKIFEDRAPLVFEFDVETPSYFCYDVEELISFLASYGYEVYDFFGNRIADGKELLASGVWNYFSTPDGRAAGSKVRDITSSSLSKRNIGLPPLP